MMVQKWHKLIVKRKTLQLRGTLNGGQSFRWKPISVDGSERWIGVFASKVWILEQKDDFILYQVYECDTLESVIQKDKGVNYDLLLYNYFQLDKNIEDYYKQWSERDPYFKKAAEQFYAIRILKQEPVENIISFMCSSNNNISRITSMVEKLAALCGNKICEINGISYFSFPTIEQINIIGIEEKLRENKFGYRAKYIAKSIHIIKKYGEDKWIQNLQTCDYSSAKNELMNLPGIGAKIADCICLMSLGHLQAVPVDTHIYQIAARFYISKLEKQKTITTKIYNKIGDHFRNLYGPLAGWAHTILFCADLKSFQRNESKEEENITSKRIKKA